MDTVGFVAANRHDDITRNAESCPSSYGAAPEIMGHNVVFGELLFLDCFGDAKKSRFPDTLDRLAVLSREDEATDIRDGFLLCAQFF